MAALTDITCLFSTVRNISGTPRTFSFLPPHGRRLVDQEEFTVFGNISEAVLNDIDRVGSRRNILAFERAIQAGYLEIVHTPSPILESADGTIRMLQLTNAGTISAVDPCWAGSVSDSDQLVNG